MIWLVSIFFYACISPAFGQCNTTGFPYAQAVMVGNVTAKIVQIITSPGVVVSGTVQVIDGCSVQTFIIKFRLKNFVFYGADETYMYGGFKGSSNAISLSTQPIPASSSPASFGYI